MDTRTKILTPAALAAFDPPRPLLVASGRFDVLRVELARELAEARGRTGARSLLVVIRPIEGAFATLDARAELAAALRVVDYVLVAPDADTDHLVRALQPGEMVHLEEAEGQRLRQLIEHVQRR